MHFMSFNISLSFIVLLSINKVIYKTYLIK
jgi:hypothetical protein